MVPLEKVLWTRVAGELPIWRPNPRSGSSHQQLGPRRFKVVDWTTRRVVGEDLNARTTVELLKDFRRVVDVSEYAWSGGRGLAAPSRLANDGRSGPFATEWHRRIIGAHGSCLRARETPSLATGATDTATGNSGAH